MKKFLLFCLLLSVGFNLYFVKSEYIVRDDFNNDGLDSEVLVDDQVSIAQSSLKNIKKTDCVAPQILRRKAALLNKISDKENIESDNKDDNFKEEVMREKLEARYNEWIDKSENFFYDELDLSAEQVAAYRSLSKERQDEISEYFNRKTKNASKDTPSSYMLNSDDTIFLGKVAEKFEGLLKDNFGAENYRKHKQFIKKHNDNIMTDEFVQVVEF